MCSFSSNEDTNKAGFQIMYNSAPCQSNSDSHVACRSVCRDYAASNGLLTTPYYPAPYPSITDCTYTISQNNGTYINLTFLSYDIYDNDFIEIRDGISTESTLIGIFHGYDVPTSIKSTKHNMWLR